MSGGEFFLFRILLAPITATWWICAGYVFSYLKSVFGSFLGFVVFGLGILAGLPLLLHLLRFGYIFIITYFDRYGDFEDLVNDSTWFTGGGRSPSPSRITRSNNNSGGSAMRYKENSGCGGCAHASNNTKGSGIQRGLSQELYNQLAVSNFSYHCFVYNRFVETDRGKTCPSWKSDDPNMS